MGGGIATFIREYVEFDDDDKKLVVLAGMAAAIGSLFPSPILTVLLFFELGKPPRLSLCQHFSCWTNLLKHLFNSFFSSLPPPLLPPPPAPPAVIFRLFLRRSLLLFLFHRRRVL